MNKISNPMINRDKIIIRSSTIGIIANIFLASFKAFSGFITGSIAIILDAVNNLSDALSSLVTIIGTKLASKLPDKEHPMGHGRAEYLSALVVAAIVLYAGITAAIESIKKIIHPEKAEYTFLSLLILSIAIIVKFILGTFVKSQGKKVNSSALVASGTDAFFDAILSISVLASALIFIFTGFSLEAYIGAIISIFIIKSGIEMITETVDDILGHRAEASMTKEIKKLISEEKPVRGAYDLILDNYGPDKNYASVHIELPDTMTVEEVDILTRKIEKKIFLKTGVILTGVGIYSYNTKNDEAAQLRNSVQEIILSYDWALQMHGFYADTKTKEMRFDVVLSFEVNAKESILILYEDLKKKYPEYSIQITPDIDISD